MQPTTARSVEKHCTGWSGPSPCSGSPVRRLVELHGPRLHAAQRTRGPSAAIGRSWRSAKGQPFSVGPFSCALPRVRGDSWGSLLTSFPGHLACLGQHSALSAPFLQTTSLRSAAARPACGCPKSLPAVLSLRPRSPFWGWGAEVRTSTAGAVPNGRRPARRVSAKDGANKARRRLPWISISYVLTIQVVG